MKIIKKIVISAISLLATGTIFLSAASDNTLTLTTLSGKSIHVVGTEKGFNIPEYKGKILFVEFWGTRCPPCLMSIPHYIELQSKYKDELAILAVEVQMTPKDTLKEFVSLKGINYDIVAQEDGHQFVDYIAKRASWQGSIPLLVILDQNGTVQIIQPGMIPQENLEKVISEMLKAKKDITKSAENNSSKNNSSDSNKSIETK